MIVAAAVVAAAAWRNVLRVNASLMVSFLACMVVIGVMCNVEQKSSEGRDKKKGKNGIAMPESEYFPTDGGGNH